MILVPYLTVAKLSKENRNTLILIVMAKSEW